jgi:RecB family exonuclease
MSFSVPREIWIMSNDDNLIKLSVSKVKIYSDCAKKFHYSYVLKLPKKEFSFHIFGKFIHKVLENFHNEYIQGSTDSLHKTMEKAYKSAMAEYKSKMTQEAQKEAYDIIDAYLQKISIEKDTIKNILAVEKNFNFNISDTVILNGMIDRIQLDPDGILHVADYKTTKNKNYLKNDFMQLLTYAYVILNEDPTIEKVRGSYILLRHNFEYITKEFSKPEILEIKNKYEDYAKMIGEEKLWRPNPSQLCSYCDFLELCETGRAFVNKSINNKHGEMSW